jgi:hypothetical protein
MNFCYYVLQTKFGRHIVFAPLHMAYDIPTRFHKVWSRHLREIERTKMCGRIRIIVKKKRSIAIHHPTTSIQYVCCIYMTIFVENELLLLCPPNEVWETYCVCSVSYYITPTVVGWCIAMLRFFFTIILILANFNKHIVGMSTLLLGMIKSIVIF